MTWLPAVRPARGRGCARAVDNEQWSFGMPPTDLVMQRDHPMQTMTADRPFLCSASLCCAVVAQGCVSHVMLVCRSVKVRHRRSKQRMGNINTGALELTAPARLQAAHHSRCACISEAPSDAAWRPEGLLAARAEAERRQCVRSLSGCPCTGGMRALPAVGGSCEIALLCSMACSERL